MGAVDSAFALSESGNYDFRNHEFHLTGALYVLFSRSGHTDGLERVADTRDGLLLVDLRGILTAL